MPGRANHATASSQGMLSFIDWFSLEPKHGREYRVVGTQLPPLMTNILYFPFDQPKRAVPREDAGNPTSGAAIQKIFIGGIKDKPITKVTDLGRLGGKRGWRVFFPN